MFGEVIQPVSRPCLNTRTPLDIPTGKWEKGRDGSYILNGGLASVMGIVAEPNRFKTWLAVYMGLMVRAMFRKSFGLTYDAESTFDPDRHIKQSRNDPYLSGIDFLYDGSMAFTDESAYDGTRIWKYMSSKMQGKIDDKSKQYEYETPFIDPRTGKFKKAIYPTVMTIDSFSGLTPKVVEDKLAKFEIGSSDLNMVAVNAAGAKSQIVKQLNGLCARSGTYFILTGLVGEKVQLDPYAPKVRQLHYLGNHMKIKDVPRNFATLPHNMWYIHSSAPLMHKETKTPLYPKDNKHAIVGSTDLNEISLMNLRGKNGPSGFPVSMIISQSEGLKPELSYYHLLRTNKYWGMGGNNINHFFHLYPDVTIGRTTVNAKLSTDKRMANAAQLTSDLLQVYQHHREDFIDVLCEPEELYKDIKDLGYDWDRLLDCRLYWCPNEEAEEQGKETLSIIDLLNMRAGKYIPWWMTKEEKEALKY